MPIQNPDDAVEVEERIRRIFAASSQERTAAIRRLFVEVLDFDAAAGEVSLEGAPGSVGLPGLAHRIAELDGVHVLHVALPVPGPHTGADRVRKAEVDAAARLIADQLGDDLMLVFTNPSASQLHLILPGFTGSRPTLRRMVVERDLPRRTAVQQVSNIYWRYRARGSIRAALEEAFDVGPVTREFFAEYKRIFDAAEASVSGFQDTDEGREERRSFVQTLFNRLMFVYFLQRKGWLTFKGDKDYLNVLWRDYQADPDGANFFAQRLDPLFFAGLNNPQSRDLNDNNIVLRSLIGQVPFLNGGLFEQTDLDRRGVNVPDSAIEQVLGGLFDRFNFTVMESTPFDIEVAVDPEMLGKVFEEMVTGRHESGAYYTPRPVVSFMCREALKGYLEGQDTGLDAGAIAQFVDLHDPSGLTLAAARRISEALDEVKVVDPACGSGAYLLGMMQELVELQATLYSEQLKATPRDLYELKLHIIQRNLYGVDIDKFAVNIAMLRMWLSLAIDYEGDRPEPLPNLDLKVVRGDSLLGPDPGAGVEVQGALGQDPEQFRRLGQLKAEYMRASLGPDKERLKAAIQQTEAGIREALGVVGAAEDMVDWRVEFAEVFAQGRGFDIAIANPPYVRQENIGLNKSVLAKQYADAVTARSDLYCYFYARALQLLCEGGMHVFVCSNSWLDVGYESKLQEYLLHNGHIRSVYESAVERQFSTADINTIISLIHKGQPTGAKETRFISLRWQFEKSLANPELRREISLTRDALLAAGTRGGKYQGDKWGGKYLRAPDIYHHILEKCADRLVRLGDIATVRFGLKTGANGFFCLTSDLIRHRDIEPEFCRPVMTTPHESRCIAIDPIRLPRRLFVCHKDKEELRGTAALDYIRWGEAQGYHTRSSVRSRKRWYDLGEWEDVYLGMNKLVDVTARTYLAPNGALFTDNFQIMALSDNADPLKLCAALNSTLFQLTINVEARSNFGQGVLEIQTYETGNAFIINPLLLSEPDATLFDSADWDVMAPSEERKKLDGAVFDALGLTEDERDAVYEGVEELVGNRKRRAESLKGGKPWPFMTIREQDAALARMMLEGKEEAQAEGYASREEIMAILRELEGS